MYIENTAKKIAIELKKMNPDETNSIEMMTHGLTLLINGLLSIVLVLMAGLVLGNVKETAISMIVFIILRIFSGGYHLNTALKCCVFSVLIFITIVEICNNYTINTFIVTLISLALVAVFAPSRLEEKTLIKKSRYPLFKWISIVIVSSNFIWQSDIIALTYLSQALLTVHFNKEVNSK